MKYCPWNVYKRKLKQLWSTSARILSFQNRIKNYRIWSTVVIQEDSILDNYVYKKTSSLRISLTVFISSAEMHSSYLSIIVQCMKDKIWNSVHKCMHISMLRQRKATPHFIPLHVSAYYGLIYAKYVIGIMCTPEKILRHKIIFCR